MRRALKFFERVYERNVFEEDILCLGTFDLYRSIEEKNDCIGDRLEGGRLVKTRGSSIGDHMPPERKIWVEQDLKMKTESGGLIEFRDDVTFLLPNAYIYCIFRGNPKDISPPANYDAAFSIRDKEKFYELLYQGEILDGAYAGAKISDISSKAGHRRIDYIDDPADVFSGNSLGLIPFIKRMKYYLQKEHRFLFIPHEGRPIKDKRILIRVGGLRAEIEKFEWV